MQLPNAIFNFRSLCRQRGTMGVKRQQDLTSSCTVVLLGDARAGKTAMVNRLLTDKFSEVRLREREKKIKN